MERTIASPRVGSETPEANGNVWPSILAAVLSFLSSVWRQANAAIWSIQDRLSSEITRPPDVARISARLAVVRRADEEGRHNLPPSSEELPSGVQREIIAYFSNLRRRARQRVADRAERCRKSVEQVHLSETLSKLRDLPAACENKIHRHIADVAADFNHMFDKEQKQKRHYDAFRERNRLDRVASYSSVSYLNFIAVLTIIVAVAITLQRMFESLAGSVTNAPLGSIAALSAASVIAPFVLGFGWLRSINHVNGRIRLFGLLGLIVAIFSIAGIALYADFHIAALLADPGVGVRDVFGAIWSAPLDVVTTVANWKIVGSVAMAGFASMLLGYRSDDPYPGYGAVQRTYYRARDAREGLSAGLRKRVNGLIDAAELEIETLEMDFRKKVRTYAGLVEESRHVPRALKNYDIQLEDACNMVLDRYRVANMAVRQTEAPISFSEHVCFNPGDEMEASWLLDSSSHVAELQEAVAELENEASRAKKNLRALNLRIVDSISGSQPVDED